MSVHASDFDYVRQLLARKSAIVIDDDKAYLVESRLTPVARDTAGGDLATLIRQLRSAPDGPLASRVVEAMTTNETSWFRDNIPFQAFSDQILPELSDARRSLRRLSIWSAACSSGQEPYSLAMILSDFVGQNPGWDFTIIASDLSTEMVSRTKLGAFSQVEMNRGLPASKLVTHFSRQGTAWVAAESLRSKIEARVINLAEPLPPLPPLDVIFLRNVLIYFDVPTKQRVLERIRTRLRPDGYLFLGAAETTLGVHEGFERVPYGSANVFRRTDREA
jgi:chemotaxis protein methyltransferase CheR